MRRLLTVALVLGISIVARSGEIETARVTQQDGEYQVHLSVKVSGDQLTIYKITTDYDQLARLSDIIIESGLVERIDQDGNKIVRRRLLTKTCLILFCFVATLVEDITESGDGIIKTTIIPEESNFLYGDATWQVLESDEPYTLIIFNSRFKPDFWVPPLVGPLLIKKMVLDETKKTITNIEKIATSEEVFQ